MFHELNPDQVDSLLLGQMTGRLACADDHKPYIFPVTYCYSGKYIYGQTNNGTKLGILRRNPEVCFEVDRVLDINNWQSVIIRGVFEELSQQEILAARDILFNRVFQLMTSSRVHAHEHEVISDVDDSNRVKDIIYRIKIQEVSGRSLSISAP